MDHSEAVQLKAVEKYTLGELPTELREQFEEHYLDCVECANDVKTLATFVTASRMVFEKETAGKAPSRARRSEHQGWFSWLRPVIAVPAIAALSALLLFQNIVTIPTLKQQLPAEAFGQVYESSYRLQGATRGENVSSITVRQNESYALNFDFTPAQIFQSYRGDLLDASGKIILTFAVSGEATNKELHLVIPGDKVHTGKYNLVFVGLDGTKSSEVQRLSLAVEFRP
jgi:hypothetical protein